eukprot:scaffold41539_cov50-Phaeocystis_antarctica.AAC.3
MSSLVLRSQISYSLDAGAAIAPSAGLWSSAYGERFTERINAMTQESEENTQPSDVLLTLLGVIQPGVTGFNGI